MSQAGIDTPYIVFLMSHSAVFRDPVYSGWTLWIAAQKEAKVIFECLEILKTISLPASDKQLPIKDNNAKTFYVVICASLEVSER